MAVIKAINPQFYLGKQEVDRCKYSDGRVEFPDFSYLDWFTSWSEISVYFVKELRKSKKPLNPDSGLVVIAQALLIAFNRITNHNGVTVHTDKIKSIEVYLLKYLAIIDKVHSSTLGHYFAFDSKQQFAMTLAPGNATEELEDIKRIVNEANVLFLYTNNIEVHIDINILTAGCTTPLLGTQELEVSMGQLRSLGVRFIRV